MKETLTELNHARKLMNLPILTEEEYRERMSMSQAIDQETDNVDTLLKMMSKYTPDDYWMVSIGYLSNADLPVTVTPTPELEQMAKNMNDEYLLSLVTSDEWKSGKMKHPHAAKTVKGEKQPSTMYRLKRYSTQWMSKDARNKIKADKDAATMSAYHSRGLNPPEIDPNDKRGSGWSSVEGTPFDKHDKTGTYRYAMYRKVGAFKDSKSTYFLKKNDEIVELSPQQTDFLFKMSKKANSNNMPKRLLDIQDEELRQELYDIENMYEFKNLDLNKIPFLYCTAKIDGKPVKLEYVNKKATPSGVNPGDFETIIDNFIGK